MNALSIIGETALATTNGQIVPARKTFGAGIYPSMPASTYYSDPCEKPSLSQSMAKTLLGKSPIHAYRSHPRLGGESQLGTKAMAKGDVIHDLLLKNGSCEKIVVLEYKDYRTKAAQEDRDKAEAEGLTPILEKEWESLSSASVMIMSDLAAAGISFAQGQTEVAAIWEETADNNKPIWCRSRIDHLHDGVITDMKTTASAHPDDINKSIRNFGYDIQQHANTKAIPGSRMRFVFVELEPPYLFTIVEMDESLIALGRAKWRRAVNLWEQCLRTGQWPGYYDGVFSATARPWDIHNEIEMTTNPLIGADLARFIDSEITV